MVSPRQRILIIVLVALSSTACICNCNASALKELLEGASTAAVEIEDIAEEIATSVVLTETGNPASRPTDYSGWTTPRYATDYVQVIVPELRLRTGPGTQYPALGYVVNNHYYPLNDIAGYWGKIATEGGQQGWVYLQGYTEITIDPNSLPTITYEGENTPYTGWDLDLAAFLLDCSKVSFELAIVLAASPSPLILPLTLQGIPPEDWAECLNSAIPVSERFVSWFRQEIGSK